MQFNKLFELCKTYMISRSENYDSLTKLLFEKIKDSIDLNNDDECLVVVQMLHTCYENEYDVEYSEFESKYKRFENDLNGFRNEVIKELDEMYEGDLSQAEIIEWINDDVSQIKNDDNFGFEING